MWHKHGEPLENFVHFAQLCQKALALFFYLAMTPKPHSRELLATLLWPEMDEPRAKKNLRLALSMLRKHVSPYIEASPNTVAFNRQVPY